MLSKGKIFTLIAVEALIGFFFGLMYERNSLDVPTIAVFLATAGVSAAYITSIITGNKKRRR